MAKFKSEFIHNLIVTAPSCTKIMVVSKEQPSAALIVDNQDMDGARYRVKMLYPTQYRTALGENYADFLERKQIFASYARTSTETRRIGNLEYVFDTYSIRANELKVLLDEIADIRVCDISVQYSEARD